MGKMSREKGKRGERELANWLRGRGIAARRGVQYRGGTDSPDVICELPFHVEVKRRESLRAYRWLADAQDDAGNEPALLCHRQNRRDWLAILRLEDLVKVLQGKPVVVSDSAARQHADRLERALRLLSADPLGPDAQLGAVHAIELVEEERCRLGSCGHNRIDTRCAGER